MIRIEPRKRIRIVHRLIKLLYNREIQLKKKKMNNALLNRNLTIYNIKEGFTRWQTVLEEL